jgi:carboxymethylenebutenolidase
MIHEWWGLREEIIDKADALAAEGYIVIAPDALRGRSTSWVPSALYGVISTPPEQIDGDIETVFQWLVAQPSVRTDRIAVMGFCFGGGASLRYSLGNPKLAATVVFYGQLVTEAERLKALSGPVLGIFGGADSAPSPEQARAFEMALKQAGKSHEVTIYDGQPHAFVGDMAQVRAGGPQGAAWAQLLRFLDASLKQDRASTPILWSDTRIASNSVDLVYVLELALAHAFTQGHRGH